jgi:hypothetical protein
MNDVVRMENLGPMALGKSLKTISAQFLHISYRHVYRDRDMIVDALSKDVILSADSLMIVEEFVERHLCPIVKFCSCYVISMFSFFLV